jgi:diadenosine tetraphosphate (Ap4A) HIT family hydrolase
MLAMTNLSKEIKLKINLFFNPDGYNIGFNDQLTGGQTVMHCHMHIIPRYQGDVPDPAGGIRCVIPGKQKYK